jgi:hypothetical protein
MKLPSRLPSRLSTPSSFTLALALVCLSISVAFVLPVPA